MCRRVRLISDASFALRMPVPRAFFLGVSSGVRALEVEVADVGSRSSRNPKKLGMSERAKDGRQRSPRIVRWTRITQPLNCGRPEAIVRWLAPASRTARRKVSAMNSLPRSVVTRSSGDAAHQCRAVPGQRIGRGHRHLGPEETPRQHRSPRTARACPCWRRAGQSQSSPAARARRRGSPGCGAQLAAAARARAAPRTPRRAPGASHVEMPWRRSTLRARFGLMRSPPQAG